MVKESSGCQTALSTDGHAECMFDTLGCIYAVYICVAADESDRRETAFGIEYGMDAGA